MVGQGPCLWRDLWREPSSRTDTTLATLFPQGSFSEGLFAAYKPCTQVVENSEIPRDGFVSSGYGADEGEEFEEAAALPISPSDGGSPEDVQLRSDQLGRDPASARKPGAAAGCDTGSLEWDGGNDGVENGDCDDLREGQGDEGARAAKRRGFVGSR